MVEIVCVNPPSQTDAIPVCQNHTNQIQVPSVGQHIVITGPYVLDTDPLQLGGDTPSILASNGVV